MKSAHDKPDPRFEAARQKAEREAKVYADRAEKAASDETASDDAEDDAEVDESPEEERARSRST